MLLLPRFAGVHGQLLKFDFRRRWVPLLFGFAAVIIGLGHSVLDGEAQQWKVCTHTTAQLCNTPAVTPDPGLANVTSAAAISPSSWP